MHLKFFKKSYLILFEINFLNGSPCIIYNTYKYIEDRTNILLKS